MDGLSLGRKGEGWKEGRVDGWEGGREEVLILLPSICNGPRVRIKETDPRIRDRPSSAQGVLKVEQFRKCKGVFSFYYRN